MNINFMFHFMLHYVFTMMIKSTSIIIVYNDNNKITTPLKFVYGI